MSERRTFERVTKAIKSGKNAGFKGVDGDNTGQMTVCPVLSQVLGGREKGSERENEVVNW